MNGLAVPEQHQITIAEQLRIALFEGHRRELLLQSDDRRRSHGKEGIKQKGNNEGSARHGRLRLLPAAYCGYPPSNLSSSLISSGFRSLSCHRAEKRKPEKREDDGLLYREPEAPRDERRKEWPSERVPEGTGDPLHPNYALPKPATANPHLTTEKPGVRKRQPSVMMISLSSMNQSKAVSCEEEDLGPRAERVESRWQPLARPPSAAATAGLNGVRAGKDRPSPGGALFNRLTELEPGGAPAAAPLPVISSPARRLRLTTSLKLAVGR